MALDINTLKLELKSALLDNLVQDGADPQSLEIATNKAEKLANKFSQAIDKFVKSGEVNFSTGKVTGLYINTSGTPTPITQGKADKGVIS